MYVEAVPAEVLTTPAAWHNFDIHDFANPFMTETAAPRSLMWASPTRHRLMEAADYSAALSCRHTDSATSLAAHAAAFLQ
jgi:hypothetical protein